jgi:hypothetical protein
MLKVKPQAVGSQSPAVPQKVQASSKLENSPEEKNVTAAAKESPKKKDLSPNNQKPLEAGSDSPTPRITSSNKENLGDTMNRLHVSKNSLDKQPTYEHKASNPSFERQRYPLLPRTSLLHILTLLLIQGKVSVPI